MNDGKNSQTRNRYLQLLSCHDKKLIFCSIRVLLSKKEVLFSYYLRKHLNLFLNGTDFVWVFIGKSMTMIIVEEIDENNVKNCSAVCV